jgi:predicted nucleic acid-binding protein
VSAKSSWSVPSSIVIDASAVVELLIESDRALEIRRAIAGVKTVLAPDHLNGETLSALRRLERRGLPAQRATAAVADLKTLPVERVPTTPLLGRAWALRENVKPFDAIYVALAQSRRCPLLTADGRLAGAPALGVALIVV